MGVLNHLLSFKSINAYSWLKSHFLWSDMNLKIVSKQRFLEKNSISLINQFAIAKEKKEFSCHFRVEYNSVSYSSNLLASVSSNFMASDS